MVATFTVRAVLPDIVTILANSVEPLTVTSVRNGEKHLPRYSHVLNFRKRKLSQVSVDSVPG